MPTDADAGGARGDGEQRGVVPAPRGDLVRCGAELVALSERFHVGVFAAATVFIGLAALAALALLPAHRFPAGSPVTAAFVSTALIVACTPPAVWRARAVYRALRLRPALHAAPVFLAAALIAHPALSGELWWPSCAILMALSIVASLRRALGYCLVVLGTNLAGHLVAGDLDETPAVAVIGLWIGYPLWTAAIAVLTDRLGAYVLHLNAMRDRERRDPPLRVFAWMTEPPRAASAAVPIIAGEEPEERAGGCVTDRLTARQLQVVALLADGLRQREVAACLSISVRQVQRHSADAVTRLRLRNSYELVAVAVAEGIVPAARAIRDD